MEELIHDTIKTSIENFFKNKEVKVEHVLDSIFPKERRIRSLIGGLETSLGTTLWEPLAKAFAEAGGFVVREESELNSRVPVIPEKIRNRISSFANQKNLDNSLSHATFFNQLIEYIEEENISANEYQQIPKGEGVDIWLEKDGKEYLIDIKTTQINAGSGPKFNNNLLNWYAYRALDGVKTPVYSFIAFPFNPHKGKAFWSREKGKVSPLIPSAEALVADEFWDLLLGQENTMDMILEGFKTLGNSNFGSQFDEIFTPKK